MWSKLTNILFDKNPFIIHPTPPPQIPTITTDQTKTTYPFSIMSGHWSTNECRCCRSSSPLRCNRWMCPGKRHGLVVVLRNNPIHVAPLFFVGYKFWGYTWHHVFCWVAICWVSGFPSFVASQHPNLTSTSSKFDWSWSSGAQVLPKTSAVERRRPTAWKKDGRFFLDLNTWMHNSSPHILILGVAPSSQQAPKVNKYPWQLFGDSQAVSLTIWLRIKIFDLGLSYSVPRPLPTFGMKVYKRPYKDDDQVLDL